ncbi:MAG: SEC-C metal-binding domain-containing protein, partial [Rubrivivax sp.]|nr:SEC-C metal-binding domain-containing protein [Rubrivivax sp.]
MCDDAFDRAFADPADREQALRALRSRQAVLADQLDAAELIDAPDALRLSPLMAVWDDAARAEVTADEGQADPLLVTGAIWVEGFFDATQDFAADWRAPDEDEAELFNDLLAQLQALGHADGSAELQAHVDRAYDGAAPERERLVDEALYAVQDLRVWWVDHAPVPEQRRVDKTPGRNDPCHCGSGKKFKKCHGAGA